MAPLLFGDAGNVAGLPAGPSTSPDLPARQTHSGDGGKPLTQGGDPGDSQTRGGGGIIVFSEGGGNAPPVVNAGADASGVQNEAVYIESAFGDSDGTGPYTVTIDWGDNTSSQQTFTDPPLEYFLSNHTYTQTGQFTVTVTAHDDIQDNSDSDTLTVTVSPPPPDDLPTEAVQDDVSTDEDTLLGIDVLANDNHPAGTTLTVTSVTQPSHGSASINPDHTVRYTPAADWFGPDSFTYSISDGVGGTDTGTVNVSVIWVNDVPDAVNDAATTTEDTSVTINLVANDTDADGDTFANGSLWIYNVTEPTRGRVVNNGDGTATYTPDTDFNSLDLAGGLGVVDQFTYTLYDWAGGSDTAAVTITVNPVNDAPYAYNDFFSTLGATPIPTGFGPTVGGAIGCVLDNDADPDRFDGNYDPASLTVQAIDTTGTAGTVMMDPDGWFEFTPALGFSGWTSFTYTATDGAFVTAAATVHLYVQPESPPPPPPITAVDDEYITGDAGVIGSVSTNDSNSYLSILSTRPSGGRLTTFDSGGSFAYTPNASFDGTEVLAYLAVGQQGQVAQANLKIKKPVAGMSSMTHNFHAPRPSPGNIILEYADKVKPGVFVHLNIDNDNRNTILGTPVADKGEAGPVANEDDLMPLKVKVFNVSDKGTVTLKRGDTDIRVWKTKTKGAGNEVLVGDDEKTWDLSDAGQRAEFESLWVEGLIGAKLWVEGYAKGGADLTLIYKDPQGTVIDTEKIAYTVFGATAGRQPTPAEYDWFKRLFPNLVDCEWSITAERNPLPWELGHDPTKPVYNCIAFSVGEGPAGSRWYNDLKPGGTPAWFVGMDQTFGNNNGKFELVEDLDKFYDAKGFKKMDKVGADSRPDILYYEGGHAAVKREALATGVPLSQMYESKLGDSYQIEHMWDQLDGNTNGYGDRIRYYKEKN